MPRTRGNIGPGAARMGGGGRKPPVAPTPMPSRPPRAPPVGMPPPPAPGGAPMGAPGGMGASGGFNKGGRINRAPFGPREDNAAKKFQTGGPSAGGGSGQRSTAFKRGGSVSHDPGDTKKRVGRDTAKAPLGD